MDYWLDRGAEIVVDCMNDRGFAASYDPDRGVNLDAVPIDQRAEANGAMATCVAGLRRGHGAMPQ